MSFRVNRRTINFRVQTSLATPSVPSPLLVLRGWSRGRNCELTAREMGCAAWGRSPFPATHPETSSLRLENVTQEGKLNYSPKQSSFSLSLSPSKLKVGCNIIFRWRELPAPELLTGSGTGDKTTHNWPHPRPTNAWDRGDNALQRPVDWQNTFQISAKTPKTE